MNQHSVEASGSAAAADNDSSDDEAVVEREMNQYQHPCVDDEKNEYDCSDDEAVERVTNQRIKKRMMTTTTLTKKKDCRNDHLSTRPSPSPTIVDGKK
jgi:hypothetical protein